MFKIVGSLMVFIGCLSWGFLYADKFRKRSKELTELERCINELQNEVTYTYTPIPEILYKISRKSIEPIGAIFENISTKLRHHKVDSVYEAFYETFKSQKDSININEEDINIMLDLSKSLGQSDVEGQKRIIELTLYNLRRQSSLAKENMDKNIKMYRYLGLTIGATLVIMFV